MKKDEVFFGEVGHTSTSANYLCNLAKEKYTQIEAEINNLSFVTVEMGLIDGPKQLVKKGNDSPALESIQTKLNRIAQLKSLCSWFREALKARDRMIKEVGEKGIYQWAEMQGIALPTKPMKKTIFVFGMVFMRETKKKFLILGKYDTV